MIRRHRLVERRAAWLLVAAAVVGCTTILDIDGHYVAMTSDGGRASHSPDASAGGIDSGKNDTGGTSSGGATESRGGSEIGGAWMAAGGNTEAGGAVASGGQVESGGSTSELEDCTKTGCPKGQKCCGSALVKGSICYYPSPGVGCGDTGCMGCTDPVPTNSTPSCSKDQCSFTCDTGYMEDDSSACVAANTGGAGGAGSGGKTGSGGRTTSSGGSTSTSCQVDDDCTVSCGPAGPFACCMPNKVCGCTFFQVQIGNSIPIGYCLPRPPGF
ncbi:MAG TPA: hypothetical protein VHC69_35635 [Polyangiaceae bacterium]|nr:hypothetical protein [Polyangiaceae bacterium]